LQKNSSAIEILLQEYCKNKPNSKGIASESIDSRVFMVTVCLRKTREYFDGIES